MPIPSSTVSPTEFLADRTPPALPGDYGEYRLDVVPVEKSEWMILPAEVASIEHAACCGLEPAFEESDTDTASGWVDRCQLDLAQLWHCGELWAVTQVVRGKRGWILQIVGMAGVYDEALLRAIESWGRSIGCVRAYFSGRKGWLRREPDYKMATVTAFREL